MQFNYTFYTIITLLEAKYNLLTCHGDTNKAFIFAYDVQSGSRPERLFGRISIWAPVSFCHARLEDGCLSNKADTGLLGHTVNDTKTCRRV